MQQLSGLGFAVGQAGFLQKCRRPCKLQASTLVKADTHATVREGTLECKREREKAKGGERDPKKKVGTQATAMGCRPCFKGVNLHPSLLSLKWNRVRLFLILPHD